MNPPSINLHRLNEVNDRYIWTGDHMDNGSLDMCVMEAVAYVAGEPWSDHPQCACPVITSFLVNWNDSIGNTGERTRLLRPLVPLIVGTLSSEAVEEQREGMLLNWLIGTYMPTWFDLVPELHEESKALRNEKNLLTGWRFKVAGDLIQKVAVCMHAMGSADSYSTAWGETAGAAACRSSGFKPPEVNDLTHAAAFAARLAIRVALDTRVDIKPTVALLQTSAVDLVIRMSAVKESAA